MKKLHRVPDASGWKVSSDKGWFFLSLGTKFYAFHISIGRLSISVDAKR